MNAYTSGLDKQCISGINLDIICTISLCMVPKQEVFAIYKKKFPQTLLGDLVFEYIKRIVSVS